MTIDPPNASTVIGTFRWWVLEADAKGRRRGKTHRSGKNKP